MIRISEVVEAPKSAALEKDLESMDADELKKAAEELKKRMSRAAAELNFEEAAVLRDKMIEVKKHLAELGE